MSVIHIDKCRSTAHTTNVFGRDTYTSSAPGAYVDACREWTTPLVWHCAQDVGNDPCIASRMSFDQRQLDMLEFGFVFPA